MRTNFWIGFAQVVLILFAAAAVLIAVQKLNNPANYYRLAALATVATSGGAFILAPTPTLAAQMTAAPALVSSSAKPGSAVTYNLTVSNGNDNAQSYRLIARSSAGWADLSSLPASFNLAANSSVQFSVTVRVPVGASGQRDETSVLVSRDGDSEQESSLLTTSACEGCRQ